MAIFSRFDPWIPEVEGSFPKLRRMPEQVRLPCFISNLLVLKEEQASEPTVDHSAWPARFTPDCRLAANDRYAEEHNPRPPTASPLSQLAGY
jgi:hypothetical protein